MCLEIQLDRRWWRKLFRNRRTEAPPTLRTPHFDFFLSEPFITSQSLLWAHSVRPYNRLQDRAKLDRETWNLEHATRWSKTSGRGASHIPDSVRWAALLILIGAFPGYPLHRRFWLHFSGALKGRHRIAWGVSPRLFRSTIRIAL